MSTHAVYRLYARTGDLLYVGCSNNFASRLRSHAKRPWGDGIARVVVDLYAAEAEAREAEGFAIASERPRYNIDAPYATERAHAGERRQQVIDALRSLTQATQLDIQHYLKHTRADDPNKWVGVVLGRLIDDGVVEVVGERPALRGRHRTARIFALVTTSEAAA